MAQVSTIKSAISGKDSEGQPANVVGRLAGFGSIFGIIAAVVGFVAGIPLVPISGTEWTVINDSPLEWTIAGSEIYHILVTVFMFILAASFMLQGLGSKRLREHLGSSYAQVLSLGFLAASFTGVYATGYEGVSYDSMIPGFLQILYLLGAFFIIMWQLVSVLYIDTYKGWNGFLAGIFNGLFIPVLALSPVVGSTATYAAYALLLVGQLFTLFFWWSPMSAIREYARSPDTAKLAFAVVGFLTAVIGMIAVFLGPITIDEGVAVWRPWGTPIPDSSGVVTQYYTNPALVLGFSAMLVFWIMLSPRLGARELKEAQIGEDIIKGGTKYFALLLALFGVIAAAEAGTFSAGVASWAFFLTVAPAGAMFVMGASYCAKTDIVTGLPLVVSSVFIMITPFTLAFLVQYAWIVVLITQVFLIIETKVRGLTGFSQGALTVLFSIGGSVALIIIMMGGLGSGPLAIWPTNRWFNITLLQGIPAAIQSPTIIVLPFLALLIRNVALSGYAHGRGYATGSILMGASMLFAMTIPVIAGNESIGHVANTGAALVFALYAISLMLVMSLNLSLANDVEESGHSFEGAFIRVSTISGVIFAAIMLVLVLTFFGGLPDAIQIGFVVSMMVTFVVGAEILSAIGWLIAGFRLGMMKQGFGFFKISK
ncbi:MAG: hypothetical protein ACP6KW_06055 [Candidatus Thorarchaeota archaeon]